MHAYLLIGTDTNSLDNKIDNLSKSLGEQQFEFHIHKIDEVRKLSEFIKLAIEKPTVIVCKNIQDASTESLNAFLKLLEEPQPNIKFILTASNEYSLLPTIVSRCQVIRVSDTKSKADKALAESFIEMSVGQRLDEISKIKKREDAVYYLEGLQKGLHQMLIEGDNYALIAAQLRLVQSAHQAIKRNGNVGLQLTNFVISS
jgi:DNA polymerase III delta prime subunit